MMEIYRIRPEALPRKLYRIDYHDTWSKFLPGTGFQAAALDPNHRSSTTITTFQSASDLNAFWQCMRDQPNPRSCVRSPFVALFSNRRQAKTWALRWEVKHQRACDVVEISGMALLKLDVPVFHPHTLRFRIPDLCNTQESEYLCLHSVPETAIVSRRSTSTIPTGQYTCAQCFFFFFFSLYGNRERMQHYHFCFIIIFSHKLSFSFDQFISTPL